MAYGPLIVKFPEDPLKKRSCYNYVTHVAPCFRVTEEQAPDPPHHTVRLRNTLLWVFYLV